MKKYPILSSFALLLVCCALFAADSHTTVEIRELRDGVFLDWREEQIRSVANIEGYTPATQKEELCEYGGYKNKKLGEETGFFHTQKIDGRWWLVCPHGHLFWYFGCDNVDPDNMGEVTSASKSAYNQKFGSTSAWAQATKEMFADIGINSLGGWTNMDKFRNADAMMPYAPMYRFMESFYKAKRYSYNFTLGCLRSDYDAWMDEYSQQVFSSHKDDPWLIGYFTESAFHVPIDALDRALRAGGDVKAAAQEWMSQNGVSENAIDDTARDKFLEYVYEKHFGTLKEKLAKYDPNHMLLGSRSHCGAGNCGRPGYLRAAAKVLDIMTSSNAGSFLATADEYKQWRGMMGDSVPIMITECVVKANDVDLPGGNGNDQYSGWIVRTQEDRGNVYQNWIINLIESGAGVGLDIFGYFDKIDANRGIVSPETWEPHTDYVSGIRTVTTNALGLAEFFDSQNVPALHTISRFSHSGRIHVRNTHPVLSIIMPAVSDYTLTLLSIDGRMVQRTTALTTARCTMALPVSQQKTMILRVRDEKRGREQRALVTAGFDK
jgi:hypothetical protein